MKKSTLLLFTIFFALSSWANTVQPNTVKFKRQDSDHIKQVFEAWNKEKGDYLYESMATLVMHQQQPERPSGVAKTPFELLQTFDEQRIDRLDRIATEELENEKNATRGNRESYYWENWRAYLRTTKCDMKRGSSGGDPHNTTYDAEKYDFQNSGDYLLTSSEDNTFMVQVQQYRLDESIALIGGTTMNINGDILEFKSVENPSERRMITVNGEEIQNEKTDLILPQGGVVNYKNEKYVVKWPTGEQMQVSTRKFKGKELYDLYVSVPECRQDYDGLLGNNDGDKNDLVVDRTALPEGTNPDRTAFTQDELFGADRHSPEVKDRAKNGAFYIAHDFGDTYQLDDKTSLFSTQMTDIPDEMRYPSKPMNLSGLTDQQIQDGLAKAKKAGVADGDLFGAVYDYGYVGLDPVAYKDEYERPERSEKYKDPKLDKEGEALKNNQNTNQNTNHQPVRVYPRVFMGTGVYYPNRYWNPRTSSPHPKRPNTGNSNSGRRTPYSGNSNSNERTPTPGDPNGRAPTNGNTNGRTPTTENTNGRTPTTGNTNGRTPTTGISNSSSRSPSSRTIKSGSRTPGSSSSSLNTRTPSTSPSRPSGGTRSISRPQGHR